MNATVLVLAVLICAVPAGEISIAKGMKAIGEPAVAATESAAGLSWTRAICNGWLWVGIALMTISFYSLLLLLSVAAGEFRDSGVGAELCGRHARRQIHSA